MIILVGVGMPRGEAERCHFADILRLNFEGEGRGREVSLCRYSSTEFRGRGERHRGVTLPILFD